MGNSQPCKQHQPPLAPYGRAYPSVASLPSPRRFASACRGLRPLKNAWPTASDVYQGRGKPRRRQRVRMAGAAAPLMLVEAREPIGKGEGRRAKPATPAPQPVGQEPTRDATRRGLPKRSAEGSPLVTWRRPSRAVSVTSPSFRQKVPARRQRLAPSCRLNLRTRSPFPCCSRLQLARIHGKLRLFIHGDDRTHNLGASFARDDAVITVPKGQIR